jgi:S-adenosylmethionine hydrolase
MITGAAIGRGIIKGLKSMSGTNLPPDTRSHRRDPGVSHADSLRALAILMLVLLIGPRLSHAADPASGRHAPIIVFLTDYGTLDDAVAICKGVMLTIAPDARIVDITHQVKPYSIADGARYLSRTALYYPSGTIFVAVVDPGVGTHRRPIIAKSRRGQYFVVPDNGLLTPIQDRDGIESAREITNPAWMLGTISSTFHGRDIFAPAAAHIARGDNWQEAGPEEHSQLVRLPAEAASLDTAGIRGSVVGLDGPFGNLITNITAQRFGELGYQLGDKVSIRIGELDLRAPFVRTFGEVPTGQPLLYLDSSGLVSIAINQGNFAMEHHVAPPAALFISKK